MTPVLLIPEVVLEIIGNLEAAAKTEIRRLYWNALGKAYLDAWYTLLAQEAEADIQVMDNNPIPSEGEYGNLQAEIDRCQGIVRDVEDVVRRRMESV